MNWLRQHKARTAQLVLLAAAPALYFGADVRNVYVYVGLLAAFVGIGAVSKFVASRNEPVASIRIR
ncbi:MAG TPA: hypothetical protein VGQ87_00815 [Patescibacteria group bacterium]|jgi:hypothetical protein|nr:hypothetical protein [Patescibacteria group bacterium]